MQLSIALNITRYEKYKNISLGCTVLQLFLATMVHAMHHKLCAVAQLIQALCYKPQGRGLDSRWDS